MLGSKDSNLGSETGVGIKFKPLLRRERRPGVRMREG